MSDTARKFKEGDQVTFIGDPEKVVYTVINDNAEYTTRHGTITVELEEAAADSNIGMDWVPERLLEIYIPEYTPAAGDVVMDQSESIYIVGPDGKYYEEVYRYRDALVYGTTSSWAAYDNDALDGKLIKIGRVELEELHK